MKKHLMMAAAMLLAATGCTNECVETEVANQKATAPVTVRVNDFSITTEEMPSGGGTTRSAVNPASYDGVGAIDLAFYSGGTEVFKTTQIKSDGTTYSTFGEFECNLPVGSYTMVVIGRGQFDGDVFTLTSPTAAGYTSERARETFVKTQAVNITSADPVNLSATLNRIVAKLEIISTDTRIDGVSKIRTTYSAGGKSFNPTTGLATSNTGFNLTNTPSAAVGATIDVGSFVFLTTDEQKMNITIDVLDANEDVMFTKFVANVPLKRNRQTVLSGPLFTSTAITSSAFQVETDWLPYNTVNF
jgi:hypothetical protein